KKIEAPMPARPELFGEQQLQFVGIRFVFVEFPFAINRRVQRNFSPVRERPARFDLVAIMAKAVAFVRSDVFIKIELETIRQTDLDFALEEMARRFAMARKLRFPPLLELHLPRRDDVNARGRETARSRPLRLLVRADERLIARMTGAQRGIRERLPGAEIGEHGREAIFRGERAVEGQRTKC